MDFAEWVRPNHGRRGLMVTLTQRLKAPWAASADPVSPPRFLLRVRPDLEDRLRHWLSRHPEFSDAPWTRLEAVCGDAGRFLVLSAHPDDEIIGCGGTLARLVDLGKWVGVVQMTDGGGSAALRDAPEPTRRTVRLDEARRVGALMRFNHLELLALPDGGLRPDPAVVERLAELFVQLAPEVVFTPFLNDPHPDHVGANRILARALDDPRLTPNHLLVLGYETWSLVPANVFSDVTEWFSRKIEALAQYRTALKVVDYVAYCRALGRWHHRALAQGRGYAEVFFAARGDEFRRLARDLD